MGVPYKQNRGSLSPWPACRAAARSAVSNAARAKPLRPPDGRVGPWGRPWSARDLDAKLASFVSERGSINTGHVPLPLAVGADAGALTGGVPHPSSPSPLGVSVSSPAARARAQGLLGC